MLSCFHKLWPATGRDQRERQEGQRLVSLRLRVLSADLLFFVFDSQFLKPSVIMTGSISAVATHPDLEPSYKYPGPPSNPISPLAGKA